MGRDYWSNLSLSDVAGHGGLREEAWECVSGCDVAVHAVVTGQSQLTNLGVVESNCLTLPRDCRRAAADCCCEVGCGFEFREFKSYQTTRIMSPSTLLST